jgi:hypothetical protein
MIDLYRPFWNSQARDGHEPRPIGAIGTEVATLQPPHRSRKEAYCVRSMRAMSTRRKGSYPDLNERNALCDMDRFNIAWQPPSPAKTDHPYPNGVCTFQLRHFFWPHRARTTASPFRVRAQRQALHAELQVLVANRH